MKLVHARIKDYRSFVGEHEFDLSAGVNYMVGPNNCGKSNLISALNLALDPAAAYDPDLDRPAQSAGAGAPRQTRIALTFELGSSGPEKTLRKRAEEYELTVRRAGGASTAETAQTYAAEGRVVLVATYVGKGVRRQTFQAKSQGAAALPADREEAKRLAEQFNKLMRAVVVHSGQDLAELLQGRFREILHLVIEGHLESEVAAAQEARQVYIKALQDELLRPLTDKVQTLVGGMFPEIELAELVPDIPRLSETLSSVDVRLHDAAATQLSGKGTGVRGSVLVAMLQYLAEQSRRSLVLAVEEPEAFLHPAAQEDVRLRLEDLASRSDVTLLVTTHSPYVISQRDDASVTALQKDGDGRTVKAGVARGSSSTTSLLGPLFRDAGTARLLEVALSIPLGTRGIVITEGYTDGHFLRQACEVAGRSDLLTDLHIVPAGRAANVVVQAALLRATTDLPIVALLDHDDHGRNARDRLKAMGWRADKHLLTLNTWPGACSVHDIEIEDLLPAPVIEALMSRSGGEKAALDGKQACRDGWHYRPNKAWKEIAIRHLRDELTADLCDGLVWLAEDLERRFIKIEGGRVSA